MNIVHVISTLNIGGAENFVVQLANEQVRANRVTIVLLGQTNSLRNYIRNVHPDIKIVPLGWKKKYSIRQFMELYRHIHAIGPKVIHVHLHNPFYYVFAISCLYRNVKYIHTVHSSFDNWKKVFVWVNRLRYLNNKIMHVCVTTSIYNELRRTYPKLKSTVIRNGIHPYIPKRNMVAIKDFWNSFSKVPKKGVRFLAIGNINRHKNFKLLSQSFKEIAGTNPEVMCVQVGLPLNKQLTDEVIAINAPNVFLAGEQEKAADFLKETDALVVSSVQEGMPIVVLEALSMGVPVITTPAGGLVDIIKENYNGFITPDMEVDSMSDAIRRYIALPEKEKERLSDNAKKCFENHYQIKTIAREYLVNYIV
ncbi:glycosyltransferase [Aquimarina sp. TRL1]|uniref:glycosyltransferase n=1 Tax=Aquimarina sp. (strain TRL1) TaxID=2736252 RepID=UPI00158D1F42|nr:glycosyltransferase [Aquimarina sp. TRL1]QKX03914.1 glycosyltransferase [Aquimarina sp. TRL1]